MTITNRLFSDFQIKIFSGPIYDTTFPVVIHKSCKEPVIKGSKTMDKVLEAMENHVCKTE